jgi:hypothetical protein
MDCLGEKLVFHPNEDHIKLAKENIPQFRSQVYVEELEIERLRRLADNPNCPPGLKGEISRRIMEAELRLWQARESLAFLESLADGND